MRIAVFFVGNRLMLDDGVAPAVYDYIQDTYIFPDNIDLFDAAAMLGFEAKGLCFGMQVENLEPAEFVVGLTSQVEQRVPFLAETIVAELVRNGCEITRKDGKPLQQIS